MHSNNRMAWQRSRSNFQAMRCILLATCLLHVPCIAKAQASPTAAPRNDTAMSQMADQAATPPETLEAALHAMFRAADVVFTGEVVSIERSAGAVEVSWQVEDAVRGAARVACTCSVSGPDCGAATAAVTPWASAPW